MQSYTTEQINLELKYHRRTQQVGARSMELFLEKNHYFILKRKVLKNSSLFILKLNKRKQCIRAKGQTVLLDYLSLHGRNPLARTGEWMIEN